MDSPLNLKVSLAEIKGTTTQDRVQFDRFQRTLKVNQPQQVDKLKRIEHRNVIHVVPLAMNLPKHDDKLKRIEHPFLL